MGDDGPRKPSVAGDMAIGCGLQWLAFMVVYAVSRVPLPQPVWGALDVLWAVAMVAGIVLALVRRRPFIAVGIILVLVLVVAAAGACVYLYRTSG